MEEETVKNETIHMKQIRMHPSGLGRCPPGLHFLRGSSLSCQWLNKIFCSLPWKEQGKALPVGLVVVVVTPCLGGRGKSSSVPEPDQRETWSVRSRKGWERANGYFAAGM